MRKAHETNIKFRANIPPRHHSGWDQQTGSMQTGFSALLQNRAQIYAKAIRRTLNVDFDGQHRRKLEEVLLVFSLLVRVLVLVPARAR